MQHVISWSSKITPRFLTEVDGVIVEEPRWMVKSSWSGREDKKLSPIQQRIAAVEPSNHTGSEIADSNRPKKQHPSKRLYDQRQVNQLISVKLVAFYCHFCNFNSLSAFM